jgi:hypothetical protein
MEYRITYTDKHFDGKDADFWEVSRTYESAREIALRLLENGCKDVVIWCPITDKRGRVIRHERVEA